MDHKVMDSIWIALVGEEGLLTDDDLQKARETFDELNGHGIPKAFYQVLLDKRFISAEACKELNRHIHAIPVRCPHCREQLSLKNLDRRDAVSCSRCRAKSAITLAGGDAPAARRIHAELLEKPSLNQIMDPMNGDMPAAQPGLPRQTGEHGRPALPKKAPSKARDAATFMKTARADTGTQQRMPRPLPGWLQKAKGTNPKVVLAAAACMVAFSLIFLATRYHTWARENSGLTDDALARQAGQYMLQTILKEKPYLSPEAFHEQVYLLHRAFEDLPLDASLAALAHACPPRFQDDFHKAGQCLDKGWLIPAIQHLQAGGNGPGRAPAFWSRIDALAGRLGLAVHVDRQVNLPGLPTQNVPPFVIQKQAVTHADFLQFVTAESAAPPASWPKGKMPAALGPKPVTGISLEAARAYAAWHDMHLATEIELRLTLPDVDGAAFEWCAPSEPMDDAYPLALRYADGFAYRRQLPRDRPADVGFRCVYRLKN